VQDPEVVVIHRALGGAPVSETLRLENFPGGSSYWRQLDNFVTSIANRGKPEVDGWQAVRVLELMSRCYPHKRRGAYMNWRNETVFVTGATGFIGGRVCERMMQAGVPQIKVRALVHGMHRA